MSFTHIPGAPGATLLLSCEHASNAVPAPLVVSPSDAPWLETHWGWDLGAAALVRGLCARLGAEAVLAGCSRLVCDANRAPTDPTWILGQVEGHPLSFNAALDEAERTRRQQTLYEPYHARLDQALRARAGAPTLLVSVHSYTPMLGLDRRTMEVGVLYDDHEALAERWRDALAAEGFIAALNEPYSGRRGLIFSAQRHGHAHGVRYLELEVRQDLLADPAAVESVADRVARSLGVLLGG